MTLSSPSIQAELVDTDNAVPPVPPLPDLSQVNILSKSQTLEAPPSARRSPSPAGRLREAFAPIRKISSSNLRESSPASSLVLPGDGESTGKLKNLISRGRRGSTSSRRNSKILDDTTNPQVDAEKVPETKKSAVPPPIITTQPSTPTRDLFGGPTTVVTPPTPTGSREEDQSTPTPKAKKDETSDSDRSSAKPATAAPQSQSHSRTKSGGSGPSKLSNAISLPLTPALEEVNTPGGTLVAPSSTTGFFSSMFSAAQSAASSISNTISLPASAKLGKGSAVVVSESETASALGAESTESDDATGDHAVGQNQKRQLAVETLGSGNLSLSQFGITDSKETRPMNSKTDGPEHPQVAALRKDEGAPKAEDDSTAKAVSVAHSEKTNGEKSAPPSVISVPSDQFKAAHPEEQTPVKSLQEPENGSIKRAGSVRSRLSGSRRRRTRGSSGTTATTATVQANGVQRLQGFAVANQKRNRDFHNLFKSVPDDDLLIEDYSAALQREILLHGRLYVSEGHICFSSNILGWVTNLVISFDEVISVEKKSTAVIFQNGIVISTMHARNVFASLLNRDATYELIISMWKITHPNLKSTLNGNAVEGGGTGDKTEKAESVADGDSASEELYDEDETTEDDGDGNKSMEAAGNESLTGSEPGEIVKVVSRKVSAAVGGAVSNAIAKVAENAETTIAGAATTIDFPGPPTHETTDCGDGPNHHEKLLMDATIPAPLGKIYSMMFGPSSGTFMRKWLTEDQKSLNVQLEDDKQGLGPDKKEMSYSYIKPLGGSGFGPKQTTCIINMTLEQFDLEKAVTVACSTQNPDVPSGNSFTVKTRYCLMWGPSNSTRLIMNYTIEWTGKSWLKGTCCKTSSCSCLPRMHGTNPGTGPIEKGTADGQLQYAKDLVASLKVAVSAKSALKPGAKGKIRGAKRRRETSDAGIAQEDQELDGSSIAKSGQQNWGIFEPIHGSTGAFVTIGVLLAVIAYLLWRQPRLPYGGLSDPYRSAQYERIWVSEENELWLWLEERVGLENSAPAFVPSRLEEKRRKDRIFERSAKDMQRKLSSEKMTERQVIEAIDITRQRLEVLEHAVRRSQPSPSIEVSTHEVDDTQTPQPV